MTKGILIENSLAKIIPVNKKIIVACLWKSKNFIGNLLRSDSRRKRRSRRSLPQSVKYYKWHTKQNITCGQNREISISVCAHK